MKLMFFLILFFLINAAWIPASRAANTKPAKTKMVVLYTAKSADEAEDYENLLEVAQFAVEQVESEKKVKSGINLVAIDDKDDPQHSEKMLKKIFADGKPAAIIGPLYSNVALGLKEFVNREQVPMISIFSTHNDLTRDSTYVFRICASNRRLVKSMADYLLPEVEKDGLSITAFKDLSDDYSTDLADTFRLNVSGINKVDYNEVLFKGVSGIEKLRDLNAKIWHPTKKDILFLPTRDIVAGRILAAMEGVPHMVAAIDTVNFQDLMKRVKHQQTHIRLVTTSQWLPQKSEFSKKIEEAFRKRFRRSMTITSALTFDAAYTAAHAHLRAVAKAVPLTTALRDSTKLTGVTGLILIGPDGERVFSDQFLKEEVLE
jgi:ABC-type branched-subunit amino acid transport system substrate-binding protein